MAALLALMLTLTAPSRVLAESARTVQPSADVCVAPPDWWSTSNLQPPYEDPNSGQAPSTDCNFQQWSWTAFVHWMQTDPRTGNPLFMGLPTPQDLTLQAGLRRSLPVPNGLVMQARFAKPIPPVILEELRAAAGRKGVGASIDQAAGGALVDPNGRALYYTTHMDKTYADFASQYMGENYNNAAPDQNFPVGSTVLKAAWRVVEPGENTSKLFTTAANIEVLDVNSEGQLVTATPQRFRKETMALTGIHVVGVVNEHPEFIWATFENTNNSPDLPADINPDSQEAVSDRNWLFYTAGTAANDSNVSNKQGNGVKVPYTIDAETQKITPTTNVFRLFAHGGAEYSQPSDGSSRVANIDSINSDFMATIAAGNTKIKPDFANYKLIGSLWIDTAKTPLEPGLDLVKDSVGSIDLANSVLETFFQKSGQNCFTCHTTDPYVKGYEQKNIAISHIISNSLNKQAGVN